MHLALLMMTLSLSAYAQKKDASSTKAAKTVPASQPAIAVEKPVEKVTEKKVASIPVSESEDLLLALDQYAVKKATEMKNAIQNAKEHMTATYLCDARILYFKENYYKWFHEHLGELQALEKKLTPVFVQVNKKIQELRKTTIETIPALSQDSDSIPVNLDSLIQYVEKYNSLIKICGDKDKRSLYIVTNTAELNPASVTGDQAKAAIDRMVAGLNQSLKEMSNTFTIGLQPIACGYDLVIAVNTSADSGFPKVTQSLMEGHLDSILIDKKIMWKSIIQASKGQSAARIADHSIDGLARWVEFYQSSLGAECELPHWPFTGVSQSIESEKALLLTFEEANQQMKQLSVTVSSQETAPKLGNAYITFTASDQCPQNYFQLGSYIFEGCFQKEYKYVSFYGIQFAFFIDSNQKIRYLTGTDPSATLYTIPPPYQLGGAKLLINALTEANKPVITYIDTSNNVHTVDVNGNEVVVTK